MLNHYDSDIDYRRPLILRVDTSQAGSAANTFVLPLAGSGTYKFDVDWGDGVKETITANTDQTHVYPGTGIYDIKIYGYGGDKAFPQLHFNNAGDKAKLIGILKWGNIKWSSFSSMIYGCSNLNIFPKDVPNTQLVTNMTSTFRSCSVFNQSIEKLNTSAVTNMSSMFNNATAFNQTVNHFDTSKVILMGSMFQSCTNFNKPVSNFNTSLVTNMSNMFYGCVAFNQSIANFNTHLVQNMGGMFQGCTNFNQSVSSFDTSKVTTMGNMFYSCTNFNQSVSNFNTSLVNNMSNMFLTCTAFNQSVANFDTSKVTTMASMFQNCTNFKQNLDTFNVTLLTSATNMLNGTNINETGTTTRYDALLNSWAAQAFQPNVPFHAGSAKYSAAASAARDTLAAAGWIITDGGLQA